MNYPLKREEEHEEISSGKGKGLNKVGMHMS